MKKRLLTLIWGAIFGVLVEAKPCYAFGWPTFDIGEVFNTIQSTISQVQSQIATTMETYSIANIQQAIGDKLGGLQKIKDAKAKIEKAREKAEKIRKRAEKVMELKKKYEEAIRNAINDVKDAYNTAQGYVNEAKNQVENAKNQVENTVNNVKNQVENAKNQVENVKNQVENTVNNVKNQVENAKNQVENTVNGLNERFNDQFSSPEDNFDFENTSSGTTNSGQTGAYNNTSGESGSFNFGHEETNGNTSAFDTGNDLTGNRDAGDELEWGDGENDETTDEAFNEPTNENINKPSNEAESRFVNEIADEDETSDENNIFDEDENEIKLDKVLGAKEKIMDSPVKNGAEETGRREVKPFGKMSFLEEYKASYASQKSDFKTGTDDDGNFYFPDAFAQWTGINFDDDPDEDKIWAGIEKICEDLNSPENNKTQEFNDKFDRDVVGQMRANAQAHSAVGANEADSGKTVGDLSGMIDAAGGTTMMQMSGLGEIGGAQIHQNRQEIIRLSDEVMARVFDEIRKYCYHWPEDKATDED